MLTCFNSMQSWSFYILWFIIGSIIGSFLNVVILRVPEGKSIVFPGSSCMSCGTRLKWWMNIPILSYFLLKGKCYYCHKPVSIQYPLVELVSAIVTMLMYVRFGITWMFFFSVVQFYVLLVIAVIDLNTQLILNKILVIWFLTNLIFFVLHIHVIRWNWGVGLAGAILGLVFYYFIAILGKKMFDKESLGMGDVKFAFVAGFLLGVDLIIPMTILASVLAMVVVLPFYFKKMGQKQLYIPFGPFLCTATFLLLIYGDLFRNWYYSVL